MDKFTTFWCNVSWGLRAPKIIEIGSRLTELFLKKQKGGGFLGTQCTCTLPPRGKTLNETLNIVLVYVDWLAVWRSGNSVVRVSRVDRWPFASDVNKDLTLKAKGQDKDQTPKDKDKDKDQTFKAKDQDKD